MQRSKKGLGAAVATIAVIAVLAVGIGVASASDGGKPEPKPVPPPPNPKPVPQPVPAPVPQPVPQPPPKPKPQPQPLPPQPQPGGLKFDLDTNWGICPPQLRVVLAIAELASGIPGLARATFVKWWQAYRANQPIVSTAEAQQIIKDHPDLCQPCLNPADGPSSAFRIDKNIKSGWPAPADLAGWKAGSRGLGDILGSTAVWQGIEDASLGNHQYVRGRLPLLDLNAKEAMERLDVQAWLAGVIVWQFLAGVQYKVLASGKEAANGDSYNTWGNIFSAWAAPDKYVQGQGQDAKLRYLARAEECGIDLSQVDYPWPPGKSYKYGNDKGDQPSKTGFQPYFGCWHRVQIYFPLGVSNSGPGQGQQIPPQMPAPKQEDKPMQAILQLPGGQIGRLLPTSIGAQTPAPLVILLHGRDGSLDQLAGLIPPNLPARVVAIRGAIETDTGWLYYQPMLADPAAVQAVIAAASTTRDGVRKLLGLYPTTRVVAVGYSHGGAIALRLAEIGLADQALSVASMLPAGLAPVQPTQAVVRFVHGSDDSQIAPGAASATADAFGVVGAPVQLEVVQGAGHALAGLTSAARSALQGLLALPAPQTKGYSLTADCHVAVDSAAASLRFLLPAVQDGTAQATGYGKPTTVDALRSALVGRMAQSDPQCLQGQFLPLDAASARQQYLLLRGVFQCMMLRGALTLGQGAALLTDAKNRAVGAGVQPADLPAFEGV